MFIKKNSEKKKISFNLLAKIYFFFSIILIFLGTLFISNTGIWENNKSELLNRFYFNGIDNYTKLINILVHSIKKFSFKYQTIELNIDYENQLIIEKNRKDLVDNSILSGSKRKQSDSVEIVEAQLVHNNKNYNTRIRLKGDRTIHFRDKEKSSYKIEISGDERLNGMKKFSFIKPRVRNYIHEWLFHEFSGEGNLIKLNYEFVYLYINGSNQGLYILEENFGKELVERNKRRNGPIFTVLSEFSWDIFNSELDVYNKKYWYKKENIKILDYSKKKLKSFLKGEMEINDTFDIKKWAWYFAVTDLTYTFHGANPNQVKLFYNPVSGLFEPIPYDGHRFNKNFNKNLKTFESRSNFEMASTCLDPNSPCRNKLSNDEDTTNQWRFRFFYKKDGGELNQEFFQAYVEAIKKISDNDYLEKFFSKKNKEIERINSAIYSDYFLIDNTPYDKYGPGLYYFSKKDIFHRAKVLNDKIQPLKNKIKIIDNISEIILENKDPVNHQLTLNNLHCENLSNKSNNFIDYNPNLSIGFNKKFILKKKIIIKNTKCVMAEFVDKNGKKYQKQIIFEPKVIFKKTKNQNFLKYFIEENNVLKLMNKFTTINENLFIPENYLVVIQPGEKISLTNNAFIFSKSPWKVGGESGKVEIKGKKDNFGGGILILNTSIKSVFINTDFSYLSGLEEKRFFDSNYNIFEIKTLYQGNKLNDYSYKMTDSRNSNYNLLDGRILYGSLNLFNTTADIINCSFSKIDSEDGINFISSRYLIKNVKFEELSGDAIDIDFGSGQIINSLFKNIGNDGVDLSGTESFLKNLEFVNISDKIISVGENSNVQILNLKGTNSFVGVASKDGSKTIVQEVEFNGVNIPFASYIKKLSYEAANLDVKKISTLKTFEALGLKDENSEIFIDGESKGNIEEDILNIIYKRLPIKKDDRRI